jgi:predicted nuclease with TOPRIM domain
MKSERLWVLVLALTTFCAGLAAGVLLSFGRAPAQESRPFAGYESRLTEAFDLDEERVENLRYILEDYEDQIDALKERNIAALDPELVKIGLDHRELIRTWVVPEHHRQEFDLWVGGLPVLPSRAASDNRPQ